MQVSSAAASAMTATPGRAAPARPQQPSGFDGDGDGSAGGGGQVSAPVANLNGQVTGQIVNTKA